MTSDPIDPRAIAAAANNAAWCDAMCRAHGSIGRFDADAWTSPVRTPPFYPDAVTMGSRAGAIQLLDRIDHSAGCSVKDSFATLDLAPFGFDLLFDATWIHRPPSATGPRSTSSIRSSVVADTGMLAAWQSAWAGDEKTSGLFLPALLVDPAVTMIAAFEGDAIVAGGVINETNDVVGISNVFAIHDRVDEIWATCVDWIAIAFPGRPIVGYEAANDLDAARSVGFDAVGPLRVWLMPD